MKTSNYTDDEPLQFVECSEGPTSPEDVEVRLVETLEVDEGTAKDSQFVSAEDLSVQRMETQRQKWRDSQASLASSEVSVQRETQQEERWSDTQISPPSWEAPATRESRDGWSEYRVSPPAATEQDADTIPSDGELAAALCDPASDVYYTASSELSLVSDTDAPLPAPPAADKECVSLGHVAAMRERFESMTRANTPCPDAARAPSPSLDLFRNITPSPDLLR